MIKSVIIDNEKKSRKTLSNFLQKYCKNVEVLGEADGVSSGIELIKKENPELVFLDIEMTDGTGFKLLESFDDIQFSVIFVTAYSAYAIKAFKISAIAYLLKPINPQELIDAIDKYQKEIGLKGIHNKLEVLLGNQSSIKKIAFPTSEGIELVKLNQIIHCEADDNYTSIYLANEKRIIVSKTIKEYDTMLSDFGFFRIHQSHLVNLDYISKFNKNDGGYVVLENGKKLPVSRRNKQEFLEKLLR
ncbi:LytR/AlgR family response regulator transcription factor [Psychroserpens ponticola]|uniref:LytTR family DNA-binding domain-containing protein n=1 Tax=Psychroserpens ponticola TaxID=2932268 RepID=A0ABY7RU56_9FLAO|nr:LytTR family DNA-binding domain-containing protein [Psychroserpens ponticola]WCO00659.1 LytTR family DNA-binding domain-containing protein [Psychroserpens ponticola]